MRLRESTNKTLVQLASMFEKSKTSISRVLHPDSVTNLKKLKAIAASDVKFPVNYGYMDVLKGLK